MTPSRFSSRWMCAHSGRTRSCTGAARGNNRVSSAAVPRGSSLICSLPCRHRFALLSERRSVPQSGYRRSVHDPRSRCSTSRNPCSTSRNRCSTSSEIDVPTSSGIGVPLRPEYARSRRQGREPRGAGATRSDAQGAHAEAVGLTMPRPPQRSRGRRESRILRGPPQCGGRGDESCDRRSGLRSSPRSRGLTHGYSAPVLRVTGRAPGPLLPRACRR